MELKKTILLTIYKNSQLIYPISQKQLFNNQFGGGKKLRVSYEGHEYVFEKSNIDNVNYILYSFTDNLECVSILINIEEKVAEIHGIGNYKTCVSTSLSNTSVGSHLLKITIKMLKKYKDKLNINHIVLIDNSKKKCDKVNINLTKMLILLTGNTWYGKYGFRPYDNDYYVLHNKRNDIYNNNIYIMNTKTISDIDIMKYIKLTKKELLILRTQELLNSNPKYLLKDYIADLLRNYDKSCKYFYLFYEKLFDDLQLSDFRGFLFGLKL